MAKTKSKELDLLHKKLGPTLLVSVGVFLVLVMFWVVYAGKMWRFAMANTVETLAKENAQLLKENRELRMELEKK